MTDNQRVLEEITKRGYKINEEGTLFNPKGKEVKGSISKPAGYKQASLRILEFSAYKLMFHRIQAYQKYGNKLFEEGIEVRHKNGDKLDNSSINILIGTHSENLMDIPKIKRMTMSSSPTYDHSKILDLIESGKSYREIEELLGVKKSSISYIKNKSLKSKGIL